MTTSTNPVVAPRPSGVAGIRASGTTAARSRAMAVLKHVLLILFGVGMVFPLLWMVSSSLKPDDQIFRNLNLIPIPPRWQNYVDGWTAQYYSFGHYMVNSLVITLATIVGNLVSCSMAAYGFTRLQWRGRQMAFGYMLMTLMLPIYVLIVPQYIMWAKLGFINSFVPLILPKFLATDAFFVFLMVQFFRGLPRELDEAAKVDGASYARIYFQVLMPNALPALATTAIFTFIWTWNDFFNQLLYLTKPANLTAAVALRNFADATSGISWGPLFAMSTLSLIPVFIVFLFGQRYLVEGVATTGLK